MPSASILLIGNELLSGQIQDKNVAFIAQRLFHLGIDLKEVRIVPDRIQEIAKAVSALRLEASYLFTTGGIGATHDDITAESVAHAFGVDCYEEPLIIERLKKYYGDRFHPNHHFLAKIPIGAQPLDSRIGFRLANVFCLPGVPHFMQEIFVSLESQLEKGTSIYCVRLQTPLFEEIMADKLRTLQEKYPDIDLGSYPQSEFTRLVIKGRNKHAVDALKEDLFLMAKSLHATLEEERLEDSVA